ncbi:MAG: hypothetical protein ABI947_12530 [Chloroflexota bacterium]
MSIDAVLQQLIAMMRSAGVSIPDEVFTGTNPIKVKNPDPTIVYAVFKKFAYMTFDCSHFDSDDDKFECIEWEDDFILFQCGVSRFSVEDGVAHYGNTSTFRFGFRRAFSITFKHGDHDTLYTDLITCTLEYELSDELAATKSREDLFVPHYNKPSGLDELFADIEALDVYPLVMNKYRPKYLVIFESD